MFPKNHGEVIKHDLQSQGDNSQCNVLKAWRHLLNTQYWDQIYLVPWRLKHFHDFEVRYTFADICKYLKHPDAWMA